MPFQKPLTVHCVPRFSVNSIEHGEQPEALRLTDAEQYLLNFRAEIARNRGEVADALYAPIRQRFTESEVVVLVAFAGQMIATNLFNNVLEVKTDEYLYPYLPVTKSITDV